MPLSNAQWREFEIDLAKKAIRSVLATWGVGWFSLSIEQREGALALDIMKYCSGHSSPRGLTKWGKIEELQVTAKTCQEILRICCSWSITGDYGHKLVGFAEEDPEWELDPIPYLKKYVRLYGA